MHTYTVAILEDDDESAESLAWLLGECIEGGLLQIEHLRSVAELAQRLASAQPLDVLFADLSLYGNKTAGIEAVKHMLPRGSHTQVVYVTGHAEYCTKVYQTGHVYFLLKPVSKPDLQDALSLAISNIDAQVKNVLQVKTGGDLHLIPLNALMYVESMRRKLLYYTENGVVEAYGSLSALAKELPKNFLQCHRSYVVNMDKIASIVSGDWQVAQLLDGSRVPIGQRRYSETKRAFARYIAEEL